MAAVLAGTNSMAQHSFYFASSTAAAAWIVCYGLASYSFGEAFAHVASPAAVVLGPAKPRSEEHTSELQSRQYLVCRLLLEKKKKQKYTPLCHVMRARY